MTIREANKIVKQYNRWRRGAGIRQPHPKILGIAIDTVTEYVDKALENE